MVSGHGILWFVENITNRHLCIIRTFVLPSTSVQGFTILHYSTMFIWFYCFFSEEHIYINIFITVQYNSAIKCWYSLSLLFSSIVSPHSIRHYENVVPVHVSRISLHSSVFTTYVLQYGLYVNIYGNTPNEGSLLPCFMVQVAVSN